MTDESSEHETAFVRAFVIPQKRARLLDLLANPKRRFNVLETLSHFRDLDQRFARRLSPSEQSPTTILAVLKSRGAPQGCYLISEEPQLDGKTMPLQQALERIVGMGIGTIVSCIPGRLGYFEGEEIGDRWILERRST